MIKFNNLHFSGQNYFSLNPIKLQTWTEQSPDSSYKMTYNGQTPLSQISVTYKNLYL